MDARLLLTPAVMGPPRDVNGCIRNADNQDDGSSKSAHPSERAANTYCDVADTSVNALVYAIPDEASVVKSYRQELNKRRN